jgi:hypothetical protein
LSTQQHFEICLFARYFFIFPHHHKPAMPTLRYKANDTEVLIDLQKGYISRYRQKRDRLVAPAKEQVPQLYSPLASSIATQWYSAIAE